MYDPPYTAPSRALLFNTPLYPAASIPRNTSVSTLSARPTTHVALTGPGGAMEVRRLAIARASDTANATWAGVSHATPDAPAFGDEVAARANVVDAVDVLASAACGGFRWRMLKWRAQRRGRLYSLSSGRVAERGHARGVVIFPIGAGSDETYMERRRLLSRADLQTPSPGLGLLLSE
jgi:hypothetical protein